MVHHRHLLRRAMAIQKTRIKWWMKYKDTTVLPPCPPPNLSPSPSHPHSAHRVSPSPRPTTPHSLARDQAPYLAAFVPTIHPYSLRSFPPVDSRPYPPMASSNHHCPPCVPRDVTPPALPRDHRELRPAQQATSTLHQTMVSYRRSWSVTFNSKPNRSAASVCRSVSSKPRRRHAC